MKHSPLSNHLTKRHDLIIAGVRDMASRRDAQVWEGIASGAAGSGSIDNPKDLRIEPGSIGPDTDSWDRTDAGDYLGVKMYTRRTEWDASSGELITFKRELLFDSRGMLYSISAETLAVTDETEAC